MFIFTRGVLGGLACAGAGVMRAALSGHGEHAHLAICWDSGLSVNSCSILGALISLWPSGKIKNLETVTRLRASLSMLIFTRSDW